MTIYYFNLLYLLQTAWNIKIRHNLIKGAIGVFPEEELAFFKVTTFSWVLPLTLVIGSFIDAFLVVIYVRFAHPWKDILFGQVKEDEGILHSNDLGIKKVGKCAV